MCTYIQPVVCCCCNNTYMNVEVRGVMAAMSLVSLLLLISLISECHSDLHWTYNIFSDPSGNYRLSWLADNVSVTFEVQAATKGLLGLGFSKSGQLSHSDAVIGWVNAHGRSTILVGNTSKLTNSIRHTSTLKYYSLHHFVV